jgi:hypothetical protein
LIRHGKRRSASVIISLELAAINVLSLCYQAARQLGIVLARPNIWSVDFS